MVKYRALTEQDKANLTALHEKGCTDSVIEDYCEDNKVREDEAFHFIMSLIVPEPCKGCKHIDFYMDMYPCNDCSRCCEDHYEKEESL